MVELTIGGITLTIGKNVTYKDMKKATIQMLWLIYKAHVTVYGEKGMP